MTIIIIHLLWRLVLVAGSESPTTSNQPLTTILQDPGNQFAEKIRVNFPDDCKTVGILAALEKRF